MNRVVVAILFILISPSAVSFRTNSPQSSLFASNAGSCFLHGGGGNGGSSGIPQLCFEDDDPRAGKRCCSDNEKVVNVIATNDTKQKHASGFLLILASFLDQYSASLSSAPYKTKMMSSGVIGTIGDLLIQQLENYGKKESSLDVRRAAVFCLVAAFYIAPAIHNWFELLNNMAINIIPSHFGRVAKAALMIMFDQTIGAIVVTFGFFYAFEFFDSLLPGGTPREKSFFAIANNSVRNNFWRTIIGNWTCWPAINFVNFLFIPHKFRVLFSNFAAIFWNMFLSQVANSKKP